MKKVLALLLVPAMIVCFAACGSNNDDQDIPAPDNTASGAEQTDDDRDETTVNAPVSPGNITLEDVMNAPESPESDFEIVEYGDGIVELTKYLGDDEIVVIPSTVNGKVITHIGAYVFANDYHPNTKAVRLPDSVKVINTGAFGLNTALEIFVAGNGLEEIGDGAFQACTNLKQIILNDGLVKLGSICLSGCSNLMQLEVPDTVTEIHMMAFYGSAEGFTIIGSSGSAAEAHAISEGIAFKAR